jgi:hypothetical protein
MKVVVLSNCENANLSNVGKIFNVHKCVVRKAIIFSSETEVNKIINRLGIV